MIILSLLLLASCTKFLELSDQDYHASIDLQTKSEDLKIVFSHNINGEVFPCGCRNFPLGGIAQVAGKLHELRASSPVIYLDSGDTFFASTVVPPSLKKSSQYSAQYLAQSFDQLGLNFHLPGDQDFALGEDYLNTLTQDKDFSILLTNLGPSAKLKSKPYQVFNYGQRQLLFLGTVSPELVSDYKHLLPPVPQIKATLSQVKKEFKDLSHFTIIVLNHGGIEADKELAKAIPEIDWIIGSHSQSFLRDPIIQGKTRIVQVLSRNHYLGMITIPASLAKKMEYSLIEVRDELKDLWKNNPYEQKLIDYKQKLEAIQIDEQKAQFQNFSQDESAPTYGSCVDCHAPQVEFWQKTAHSLAYVTLQKDNSEQNPQCIKCHSLKHGEPGGFTTKENILKQETPSKDLSKYWSDFNEIFSSQKASIRNLSKKKRSKLSKQWLKLDSEYKVTHNFANVQCLHCHDLSWEHPFSMDEDARPKYDSNPYQKKCVTCHTSDQSPDWYSKDSKGIANKLNLKYFEAKLKTVSCPKK